MRSCLVFQINDVWLGDRCEGLAEWRELMGRSVAQTHPGSPSLLPLRLLIGLTALPCCSHTHIRRRPESKEGTQPSMLNPQTSFLLLFNPSLFHTYPHFIPLFYFPVSYSGMCLVFTAGLFSYTIWCCVYVIKETGR